MQSHTFVGKVSAESLSLMDEHVNEWLTRNEVEPKQINQLFGYERPHHHDVEEPVVITTVWF